VSSIANSSINIQTSSEAVASTPCWFGEVTVIAHFLKQLVNSVNVRRFLRRNLGNRRET
jgi:hypothetical protein